MARNDLCITSALFALVRESPHSCVFSKGDGVHLRTGGGGGRDGDAGSCRSHLELSVLLLEVLVFVRVAVWELVDLDAVLLDLLADLADREEGENAGMWASVGFFFLMAAPTSGYSR